MELKIDEKDIEILDLLQKDCKMTAKAIARKIDSPVTTVFAKIKRMEEMGIIKAYKAILDSGKLNKEATAFILASFSYRLEGGSPLSQREIAKQVGKFPEVQEVHIITGDWDILIKVKEKDVNAMGRFVVDKLRTVKGIEKTWTCMVFGSEKETTDIALPVKQRLP